MSKLRRYQSSEEGSSFASSKVVRNVAEDPLPFGHKKHLPVTNKAQPHGRRMALGTITVNLADGAQLKENKLATRNIDENESAYTQLKPTCLASSQGIHLPQKRPFTVYCDETSPVFEHSRILKPSQDVCLPTTASPADVSMRSNTSSESFSLDLHYDSDSPSGSACKFSDFDLACGDRNGDNSDKENNEVCASDACHTEATSSTCALERGRQPFTDLSSSSAYTGSAASGQNCLSDNLDESFATAPSTGTIYFTPPEILERELWQDKIYACPEYSADICKHYYYWQHKLRPKPHYMTKQPEINAEMRLILVDWLVEVAQEFKLVDETLHLCVSYCDRFLSTVAVPRTQLQLAGIACLFIAAKYEEIYPPEASSFVDITDNTFSMQQLLKMEVVVLQELRFHVSGPTANVFLTWFCKLSNADRAVKFLANYLCELALLDVTFLQFVPGQLAAAAICLANLITGAVPWPLILEEQTGQHVSDFYQCMTHMLSAFRNAHNMKQRACYEKYSQPECLEVALLDAPQCLPACSM